jgi:DNA uptake protein ComE-like DNA-binding protein
MTSKARLSWICGVTLMGLTLAACGGATTSSDSSPSPSAAPTTVSAPPGGTAAPAAEKVSANTASENEIAAALKAAGVSNAERWAHEVVEYRPYPADDPNLAKLRENLAKYNPGQETTDKIVSALTA